MYVCLVLGVMTRVQVLIEPIRSGTHLVYIKLDGEDITGSPVSFNVAPAAPSSSKCKLARAVPPEVRTRTHAHMHARARWHGATAWGEGSTWLIHSARALPPSHPPSPTPHQHCTHIAPTPHPDLSPLNSHSLPLPLTCSLPTAPLSPPTPRLACPQNEPLLEKSPIAIIVTLFDKYGNQLDHGGVRVDAKASGVGVSGAKVEDNKDGTYTISLTAGPPGEVKVTVRIDGNDLPPYILTVVKAPETHAIAGGAADTSIEPVAAPEQSSPAAAEPKADEAEAKAKEAQRRQSQKPGETPKAADSSKGAEAAPPPAKE